MFSRLTSGVAPEPKSGSSSKFEPILVDLKDQPPCYSLEDTKSAVLRYGKKMRCVSTRDELEKALKNGEVVKFSLPTQTMLLGAKQYSRGKKKAGTGGPPPRIDTVDYVRCRRRFYCTAVQNGLQVTVNGVLGAIGVVGAVTNTSGRPIAGTFRLRAIDVWVAANTSTSSAGVCDIDWGSASGAHIRDTEPSVILPVGALGEIMKVHAVPPPQSLASFWQGNVTTTETLFTITALNAGAIIDLDLEWTLADNVVNNTIALTTVVVGSFYRLALDDPSGTQTIVPINFATTT